MLTLSQFQERRRYERERSKEEKLNRSIDKLSVIESMSPAAVNADAANRTRDFIRAGVGEWIGLACDKCGVELYRWDYCVYTSMPPKAAIHCPGCGDMNYATDLPEMT